MTFLQNVFETAVGPVNGTNVNFQTSKIYTAGTLFVYINSHLSYSSAPDGWIELDPAACTFKLKIPPKANTSVQIAYIGVSSTPIINPLVPVRINQLNISDTLKVELKPGYVFQANGTNTAEIVRNKTSRPYRLTRFVGYLVANNLAERKLFIDTTDLVLRDQHYLTTVYYSQIMKLEKQLPGWILGTNTNRLRAPQYVFVYGVGVL